MPISRSILLFLGFFVTFSSLSAPAEAVRVKNRDDMPHRLSLSAYPGDARIIEIAPGDIYTTHAPAVTLRLLTDGRRIGTHRARFLDEYVIWPDGRMYLQKHRPLHNRHF